MYLLGAILTGSWSGLRPTLLLKPGRMNEEYGITDALGHMNEITDAVGHVNEEFTKTYEEMATELKVLEENTAEFVALEDAEDTTLAVIGKETADAIEYAAWQAQTLINDDTYFDLDNASTFSATTCADRSYYSHYTNATRYTATSGVSGVTDASVYTEFSGFTDASPHRPTAKITKGLKGSRRPHSEKHPAVEVLYNKKSDTALGTQRKKKNRVFFLPHLPTGQRRRGKKRSSLVYTRDTDEVSLFTSIPEGMAQF